jgi:hypothetical protein
MIRMFLAVWMCVWVSAACAQDSRYVGYYYPDITSKEEFTRVLPSPRVSNRFVRVDFVTQLTKGQLSAQAAPRFALFAKGETANHLVIVGLHNDTFETLFRARAVMAQMTANVRSLPMFDGEALQFFVTFYDLLQFLEFDSLVLTDGRNWAHKVEFKR